MNGMKITVLLYCSRIKLEVYREISLQDNRIIPLRRFIKIIVARKIDTFPTETLNEKIGFFLPFGEILRESCLTKGNATLANRR